MKALKRILACLGLFTVCFVVIHRNVIKASLKGEEIPEAPAWHTWAKHRKEA